MSYCEQMWMSITFDPNSITEPEMLSELYLDELRVLALANGVDPTDTSQPKVKAERAARSRAGLDASRQAHELM